MFWPFTGGTPCPLKRKLSDCEQKIEESKQKKLCLERDKERLEEESRREDTAAPRAVSCTLTAVFVGAESTMSDSCTYFFLLQSINVEAPRPCRKVEAEMKDMDDLMEILNVKLVATAAEITAKAAAENAAAAAKKAAAEADATKGEALKPEIFRAVAERDLKAVVALQRANAASPAVQSLCCGGVRAIVNTLVPPDDARKQLSKLIERLEQGFRKEWGGCRDSSEVSAAAGRAAESAGEDERAADAARRAAAERWREAHVNLRKETAAGEKKRDTLITNFNNAATACVDALNAACAAMKKFPEEEAAAAGAWALNGLVDKLAARADLPNRSLVPWICIASRLVSALRCSSNPEAQWRAMQACEQVARMHGAVLLSEGGLDQVAETMLGWPGDGNLSAFRQRGRTLMGAGAWVIHYLLAASAADQKRFVTLAQTAGCPRALERTRLQNATDHGLVAKCRQLLSTLDPNGTKRKDVRAQQSASGAGADAQPPAMTYMIFSAHERAGSSGGNGAP